MKVAIRDIFRVRPTARGKRVHPFTYMFIWLAMILTPVWSISHLVSEINDRSENLWILNEGFRATGTVVEQYFDVDTPRMKYVFKSDGILITGDSRNPDDLVAESDVEITYNPDDPSRNFPVQSGIEPIWSVVAVSVLIGSTEAFWIWLYRQRDEYENKALKSQRY